MARLISSLLLVVLAFSTVTAQTTPTAASLAAQNELVVLNYALTLENLEAAFYNLALGQGTTPGLFSSTAFASYPANTYQYLQIIQAHENQHVNYLNSVISTAGGTPVAACTYNFANAMTSAANFIATAAALENGGQTAYDGALNGLTNPAYATAAAQIATVEARHAAYLNELQNITSPFPAAFDTANNGTTIASVIAPFIVSCPYNITLPSVRPSGVALDTNNNVIKTGSPLLSTSYTAAQQTNDIVVLNYALTLEHLEANFYNYILNTFTPAQFTTAGFPAYYYNYTVMIANHENIHVSTLINVINGRQANAAVPNCTYNFAGITSLTGTGGYLNWAYLLENTGVMAYDGAAGLITDTNLQQTAATIATVEARHAAFLNQAYNGTALGNGVPFPIGFDTAMTPAQIVTAVLATGLVTSCPYNITQPQTISSNAVYQGTGPFSSSSSSTGSTNNNGRSSSTGNGVAAGVSAPSFVQAVLVMVFVVAAASL